MPRLTLYDQLGDMPILGALVGQGVARSRLGAISKVPNLRQKFPLWRTALSWVGHLLIIYCLCRCCRIHWWGLFPWGRRGPVLQEKQSLSWYVSLVVCGVSTPLLGSGCLIALKEICFCLFDILFWNIAQHAPARETWLLKWIIWKIESLKIKYCKEVAWYV